MPTFAWYTGNESFDFWLAVECLLVASVLLGAGVQAPYGKLSNSRLGGVHLPPRLGWLLMELPATVSFGLTWLLVPAGLPSTTTSRSRNSTKVSTTTKRPKPYPA